MTAPVIVFSENAAEAVAEVAKGAVKCIQQGLKELGIFHLVLTGGLTGNLVSATLAQEFNNEPESFRGLHIWWGDERFVSLESSERNDLALTQNLLPETGIHLHPVLPPQDVPDVETSAKRYNADLNGIDIGLAILGVGPDGHVASLFPGMWHPEESRNAIAVSESPKPPAQRVSLSMAKINSSQRVWLLACGDGKMEVVEKIRLGQPSLPVNHVRGTLETLIFVDRESSPDS